MGSIKSAFLGAVLCLGALGVLGGVAAAQPWTEASGKGGKTIFSLGTAALHQFEADLDKGGDFSVSRFFFDFGVTTPASPQLGLGLSLNYAHENYNLSASNILSDQAPWDKVHRFGLSGQVFYDMRNNWRFFFAPTVGWWGESDAKRSDSVVYGGIFSAVYTFSPRLTVGGGIGAFSRLEEFKVFPFIMVNWQINEQLSLRNPFRAGPAGPAGLELAYAPDQVWEFSVGGAFRSYRFRLNEDGPIANGIGEERAFPAYARVARRFGPHVMLEFYGGVSFGGKLELEDQNGDELASDRYATAPFLGLSISGWLW
jgi:hypothetical protein